MPNSLSFDAFKQAAEAGIHYYVRPYGIYHDGEVYWDAKLPRRRGSVIRYSVDDTGPCRSLVVWDLDGNFLCSAYPISWHENDHPALRPNAVALTDRPMQPPSETSL